MQAPHAMSGVAVLAAQDSAADIGLTSEEAARRLAAYGPNELPSAPEVPLWRRVLRQFADPLVYLLLVAIAISLAAWLIEGRPGWPIDVIVIAAILIANAAIGLAQESKAAAAVAALARMTAANSTVVRDGEAETVPTTDLVPGDLLLLAEGDAVGADARLLEVTSLKVGEASLTGESEAVLKDPAPIEGEVALADRLNMVHKGTAVVEGNARAVVTATGRDTELGAIADLLGTAQEEPSPLEVEIARVSRSLGLLVLAIAAIVMVTLYVVTQPETTRGYVTILLTGVSLAVAAVPEGLVAILSLVLALGVRRMAARNAVMKRLHSVETLGAASVICSDKTGTLTRNEMTLRIVQTASGALELTGTGYVPEGEARLAGHEEGHVSNEEAALAEARIVLVGGAVANNAGLRCTDQEWQIQGDPTEAAFLVAQHKLPDVPERVTAYERAAEMPFTSDRKRMSVLGHDSQLDRVRVFAKGAPDVLLECCTAEFVGSDAVPLTGERRSAILAGIERLSADGYRTLAVAYRPAEANEAEAPDGFERDLVYAGAVGIIDPPRDEARLAVQEAHRAGVRSIMITGDHPGTARRIAADLGITTSDGSALTGLELDRLSDAEFAAAVRHTNVFARVAPRHKLRIVDVLQEDGQVVAMTGDGVNDAPALKSADIGIAMGITGTEVTKDASDMVLADDNFATIVAAVRQGRVIYANITTFLRYLLSSNFGEVTAVFGGVVLGGFLGLVDRGGHHVLPLLATQILWINLVTDSAPALALGVDPEIDDVMARPPRLRSDRLLDRAMWLRIAWVGLLMGGLTLLTLDAFLPGGLIEGHHSVEAARTAAFTTLVLLQLVNAFSARSATGSAFHRMFVNPWLWGATVLGVVLQVAVVHLPGLQHAFGTTALTWDQWLWCAAMALALLLVQEVVKLVLRLRARAVAQAR